MGEGLASHTHTTKDGLSTQKTHNDGLFLPTDFVHDFVLEENVRHAQVQGSKMLDWGRDNEDMGEDPKTSQQRDFDSPT